MKGFVVRSRRESVSQGHAAKGCNEVWKKGKLSPHYIGPFEISEKVEVLAYCLPLPPTWQVHMTCFMC